MAKSKTDDQQKMKEREMRSETMKRGKKEEVQEAVADSLGRTQTWYPSSWLLNTIPTKRAPWRKGSF